jgi:hypothetical protein
MHSKLCKAKEKTKNPVKTAKALQKSMKWKSYNCSRFRRFENSDEDEEPEEGEMEDDIFLPLSSYSFSGDEGCAAHNRSYSQITGAFLRIPTPRARGFHMLKASKTELRRSGSYVA